MLRNDAGSILLRLRRSSNEGAFCREQLLSESGVLLRNQSLSLFFWVKIFTGKN